MNKIILKSYKYIFSYLLVFPTLTSGAAGAIAPLMVEDDKLAISFERRYVDRRYLDVLGSITPDKVIEITRQAEAKDRFAQCILGILFERGICVPQNFTKATTWLERAGEQGDSEAQYRLGEFYKYGIISREGFRGWMIALGLWGDPTSGSYWYEKAAKQGHVIAQYNMGKLYAGLSTGKGAEVLPKDTNKARFWLQKAIENGCEEAKSVLEKL
jgi:TPR repeat protein